MALYSHVVLMRVTLIFGGFLVMQLRDPVPVLLLFIFIKIILDVVAHLKEHAPIKKYQDKAGQPVKL